MNSATPPTPSPSPLPSPAPSTSAVTSRPPVPPASPAVIAYAELPSRWGIVLERRADDGLAITIPLVSRWRTINGLAPVIAAGVLLAASLYIVFFAPFYIAIVPQLLLAGLGAGIVGATYLWLTRKPVVVEVTRSHLLLRNAPIIGPDGGKDWPRTVRYPRGDVYEVKYVAHSGNLVIRVKGEEMIETRPVPDARVLEWLAGQLRAALRIR